MSGYMRLPQVTKRRKFLNKLLSMIKYYLNFTTDRHLDISEASTAASGAKENQMSQGAQLMCTSNSASNDILL